MHYSVYNVLNMIKKTNKLGALFVTLATLLFLGGAATAAPTSKVECEKVPGNTWIEAIYNGGGAPIPARCEEKPADPAAAGAAATSRAGSELLPTVKGPEADCTPKSGESLSASNCKIVDALNTMLSFLSAGVILAVIANMIFAGIQYTLAQGDSGAAVKARKRVQDGVIALIAYFLLFGFIQWLIPGGAFN
jgi:hypothetical protein